MPRTLKDGRPGYEVKWVGYRKKSDNTHEPREQLMEDVPKIVLEYESKHGITHQ